MRPICIVDTECYTNWWYLAFRDITKERVSGFTLDATHVLDCEKIRQILCTYRLVGFNLIGYDIPMIRYALTGATNAELKHANDRIIDGHVKPWNFSEEFHVDLTDVHLEYVDLFPVAPLVGSLKLYSARMHTPSIQDLPIDPSTILTEEQKTLLSDYCANDLENTLLLYHQLKGQLDLRTSMSAEYGIDLMSKSDPQVAEAVLQSELRKRMKRTIQKPEDAVTNTFGYTAPAWVQFTTPLLTELLATIRQTLFVVSDAGSVLIPPELASKALTIGTGVYRMGIGGLHSSETQQAVIGTAEQEVWDIDVNSYYPSIILNEGLAPTHIGKDFLTVYRGLVERRVTAKKTGDTITAECLKVAVNGTYGKLGSKYSFLYSPVSVIQVTITGQLALLMLIESLEDNGIVVVSANTDGITLRCHPSLTPIAQLVVHDWETRTGFTMEWNQYRALYSRDVNNFVAIKTNGEIKTKGAYGSGLPLHKNPDAQICSRAVIDALSLDTDIATSIRYCTDIRQFLTVRQVTGGATWRGEPIGKVVRWYHATGTSESLHYKTNHYLVPNSTGVMPVTILPKGIPDDLDYDYYITRAIEMYHAVGGSV